MPDEIRQNAADPSVMEKHVRHQGRSAQTLICLGKLLRMFVYQNDWKVIPMAALIAGLVGLVIRGGMFQSMEGTLMGAFALTCVCVWNGCFNSIQVICRERDVIKREHRSGMHISAYIAAHMIYQAIICMMQSGITLYILRMTGVQFPEEGLVTSWMILDIGLSLLLITYAADMMSLWISSLARSSTAAMTVMPFVLIFQLVFSGGMFSIPSWASPLTAATVSSPGMKVIATQADINGLPAVTMSNSLYNIRSREIDVTLTPDQILDILEQIDFEEYENAEDIERFLQFAREDVEQQGTGGENVIHLHSTIGEVIDVIGEKEVESFLEESARVSGYDPAYKHTKATAGRYWMRLVGFALLFALLAMITLEFIDKDKR